MSGYAECDWAVNVELCPSERNPMIEVIAMTKRYGEMTAVDDVSFTIQPGKVTGFLGPNGAGKSTTMRVILGLDAPTSGRALIDGRPYADLPAPLSTVGALLDSKGVHRGRTALNHLRALAATHGIPRARVDEVIGLTGLESVAGKRVGSFSLGMGQRLGIAAALLGDPEILILDEPVNGLDPEGVLWVRNLARSLAREGRTVFLSSHLMSEVAQTADQVVVIGRGRILADASLEDFLNGATRRGVRIRSPRMGEFADALVHRGWEVTPLPDGAAQVMGATSEEVGEAAAQGGFVLHELTPVGSTLEEAYMELTHEATEYRAVLQGEEPPAGQGAVGGPPAHAADHGQPGSPRGAAQEGDAR